MLQKIGMKRPEKGNVETQCLKTKGIYIYIYLQSISFQRDSDHAVIHVITMLLALLQRPILDINAHIFRLLSIVF